MNRFHAVAAVQLILSLTAWLLLRRGRAWATRLASLLATVALLPFVVLGVTESVFTLLVLVAIPGVVAALAAIAWPGWLAPVPIAPATDPNLPRLAARLHAQGMRRDRRRKVLRRWVVGALLLALGSTVLWAEWDRRHPCFDLELVVPNGHRGEVKLVENAAAEIVMNTERQVIRSRALCLLRRGLSAWM